MPPLPPPQPPSASSCPLSSTRTPSLTASLLFSTARKARGSPSAAAVSDSRSCFMRCGSLKKNRERQAKKKQSRSCHRPRAGKHRKPLRRRGSKELTLSQLNYAVGVRVIPVIYLRFVVLAIGSLSCLQEPHDVVALLHHLFPGRQGREGGGKKRRKKGRCQKTKKQ